MARACAGRAARRTFCSSFAAARAVLLGARRVRLGGCVGGASGGCVGGGDGSGGGVAGRGDGALGSDLRRDGEVSDWAREGTEGAAHFVEVLLEGGLRMRHARQLVAVRESRDLGELSQQGVLLCWR